ncbi:hypothetical protein FRC10_003569 [Ceratobasidium sp. 414]|nr:hypothetical protein FRC10_003569 [Ceratobasidium sp. 414]
MLCHIARALRAPSFRFSYNRNVTSITAKSAFLTKSTEKDPYQYQVGFGNKFASEAVPGVLPEGQNSPQKCAYDLYAEQLESNFFPLNPRVRFSPTQLAWRPFSLPSSSDKTDFLTGLKTLAGSGDPTLHEGLAIHIYTANTSMDKRAIVNADGDLLFVPQLGRLDIQTEFGQMMVRPGEICVVQRGVRFKVKLPDGGSRGCESLIHAWKPIDVQEIYGSHFELPELGPLGANGLANPRDFEFPVASFELDQSPWEVVYKLGGKLFSCKQNHTPFDVVAYHGNPRWDVASHTYRPPYYHRNAASEFMGLIYGKSVPIYSHFDNWA